MAKLSIERKERQQIENECKELKQRVERMQAELQKAQEAVRKAEEVNDQLNEKAQNCEQETLMLYKVKSEMEAECNRLSMSNMKSEEALLRMERKAREAEILAKQMSMSLADVSLDVNRKSQYSSQSAMVMDPCWMQPNTMSISGSFHQLQNGEQNQPSIMSRSVNVPSSGSFSNTLKSLIPPISSQHQNYYGSQVRLILIFLIILGFVNYRWCYNHLLQTRQYLKYMKYNQYGANWKNQGNC